MERVVVLLHDLLVRVLEEDVPFKVIDVVKLFPAYMARVGIVEHVPLICLLSLMDGLDMSVKVPRPIEFLMAELTLVLNGLDWLLFNDAMSEHADLIELLGVFGQRGGILRCRKAQFKNGEVVRIIDLGTILPLHGLMAHRLHALLAGLELHHRGVIIRAKLSRLSRKLRDFLGAIFVFGFTDLRY